MGGSTFSDHDWSTNYVLSVSHTTSLTHILLSLLTILTIIILAVMFSSWLYRKFFLRVEHISHLFSKKSSTSYYSVNWLQGQPESNRNQDSSLGSNPRMAPNFPAPPRDCTWIIPSLECGWYSLSLHSLHCTAKDYTELRLSLSWLRRRDLLCARATRPGAAGPLEAEGGLTWQPTSRDPVLQLQGAACAKGTGPTLQREPAQAGQALLNFWSTKTGG